MPTLDLESLTLKAGDHIANKDGYCVMGRRIRKPWPGRFWDKVGPITDRGCRLWKANQDDKGYGSIRTPDGKTRKSHRVAWELRCGPVPDGMCVLHRCDTPACVNTDHLFLGTIDDNNKDRAAKGRSKGTFRSNKSHPARVRSGERHWQAKLSANAVRQIRIRRELGESCNSLAKEFGINNATVSRIARRIWRKEVT